MEYVFTAVCNKARGTCLRKLLLVPNHHRKQLGTVFHSLNLDEVDYAPAPLLCAKKRLDLK